MSVTMPGKFAALRFADERTERAELVGSANTLVRTDRGWRADNTDVDGVAGALGARSAPAAGRSCSARAGPRRRRVVGSGRPRSHRDHRGRAQPGQGRRATGRPRIAAGGGDSFCDVTHPGELSEPSPAAPTSWSAPSRPTRPPSTPTTFAGVPLLLDAIYDPWPTPLARAVSERGGEVISGLQMLLHQAFAQVEQFTGRPAPRQQMAAALD